MNSIYPPEPASCPPDPLPDSIGEAIESELEYRTRHQPLALYADQLGEAFGDDGLGNLPLLLREGTDAEVRNEIMRLFDSYWSRRIRNTMLAQECAMQGLRGILRGIRG